MLDPFFETESQGGDSSTNEKPLKLHSHKFVRTQNSLPVTKKEGEMNGLPTCGYAALVLTR
eukprot:767941-Hanusia_phi.AAC.6